MQWLKLAIALALLVLLAMAATPYGHEVIEIAGKNLAKQDMVGDYAWGLVWALVLAVSILAWPVSLCAKRNLLWLWASKCATALGLMLIYEWNYGLDAYGYFWFGQPGLYDPTGLAYGNGTEIMHFLSNLHWQYLIADSYHAMKMSFAYLGFIGAYCFYRAAATALSREDMRLLWLIVCVPSVLQWSSILGKDPLAFLGIGIYCWGVTKLQRVWRRAALLIAVGIAIAAATRPWLALILLAPLASFVLLQIKRPGARLALAVMGIAAFFLALGLFSERLKIASIDDAVQRTELISQSFARGGSANASELAEGNSIEKMLVFAPVGAFSALFRPLPGEVPNIFGALAGLENIALLFLFLLALRRGRVRMLREPLVLWATLLVLVWAFFYGFVSFHNMGSGARFRLQIMPVLVCLLLYLGRVIQGRDAEELRSNVLRGARRQHGADAAGEVARTQDRRPLPPRRT